MLAAGSVRTVVLRYNATFSQKEHLFGHSELSFAALMLSGLRFGIL
jgi:hypothetical protein